MMLTFHILLTKSDSVLPLILRFTARFPGATKENHERLISQVYSDERLFDLDTSMEL